MLELKEYQQDALDAFEGWRKELETAREHVAAFVAARPETTSPVPPAMRDFPRMAWENLRAAGKLPKATGDGYAARVDEAERPIPHVCFKVPTGGGKTLLAAAALERLNRPTGLTLWIVPTRAIYAQTKKALCDKEHPYREMLEKASGGHVKMLEKDSRFTEHDVAHYLCVMLLMLPAANRNRDREFLRMFRDSAVYEGFFPDNDDALGEGRMTAEFPDLERTGPDGPVKHSLFNVMKMLRPVVVLDEAHKAYGSNPAAFVKSVNRLDPEMVIELSATPSRHISNLLVDVSGLDLKNEEMIKLPVRVETSNQLEWQSTLADAKEALDRLDAEAQALFEDTGRYVRPIAVVRVERTGREQRDGERVHAEDVREELTERLGVPAEAVRVKSAENDELQGEDLLSPMSPVQWIITKAALMEGWDCPFAYVLVMLDNTKSSVALTQLTGRVMRMPHARSTEREALDQCYVFCHNAQVTTIANQVKQGLENEGLTGLGDDVWGNGNSETRNETVRMRERFRGEEIFLPRVLHREGDGWVELDYDRHILPEIPWAGLTPPDPQASQPDAAKRHTAAVDLGDAPPTYESQDIRVDKTLSVSWFARRLSDIVPNPWQAARIAELFIRRMREANSKGDAQTIDDAIFDQRINLARQLRLEVFRQADEQAQIAFKEKLKKGVIRFDLEAGGDNYRLRDTFEVQVAVDDAPAYGKFGQQLELSLYEPMFDRTFDSGLERRFAQYMDGQKALTWWHRVAARQRNEYYLRAWRRNRIYPDFVAFTDKTRPGTLYLFETKGGHLDNADTEYKRKALELLQSKFNGVYQGGNLVLRAGQPKGDFQLIFTDADFAVALASLPALDS